MKNKRMLTERRRREVQKQMTAEDTEILSEGVVTRQIGLLVTLQSLLWLWRPSPLGVVPSSLDTPEMEQVIESALLEMVTHMMSTERRMMISTPGLTALRLTTHFEFPVDLGDITSMSFELEEIGPGED